MFEALFHIVGKVIQFTFTCTFSNSSIIRPFLANRFLYNNRVENWIQRCRGIQRARNITNGKHEQVKLQKAFEMIPLSHLI